MEDLHKSFFLSTKVGNLDWIMMGLVKKRTAYRVLNKTLPCPDRCIAQEGVQIRINVFYGLTSSRLEGRTKLVQ